MNNKSNSTPLKKAIQDFIDHYGLRYHFDERQILEEWENLVGKQIYKHTEDVNLKDTKLYVKVKSSVARQELLFMKSRLVELINRKLGKNVIEEIIII
jgi:predicted nucleic acid-binding Zn ribbon protein